MADQVIDSFRGRWEFLSNFYPVEIILADGIYPSVEHAYCAAKTRNAAWRERIRHAKTAGAAKRLGRDAPLRENWDKVKEGVMLALLRHKFTHPELRRKLMWTGNAWLVEGNWWGDRYWGVCNGVGENRLGQLLMLVRGECRTVSASVAPPGARRGDSLPL